MNVLFFLAGGAAALGVFVVGQGLLSAHPLPLSGYAFPVVAGGVCGVLLRSWRLQAGEALQRQMDELFAIFNAIEGAVYVADMKTYEILAVTTYNEECNGRGLVGKKCHEQFQAGQKGPCTFCTNHLLVAENGAPNPPLVREFQNTKTGNWYLCIDRAIHWPDGRLVRMEIAINITERKRAEDAQRKSEKTCRELVENSLVGILLIQEGQIIYQNPEQQRLFGFLPRSFRLEEFEGIYPDDLAKLKGRYGRIVSGEATSVDLDFRFYPAGRPGEDATLKWVYCRARVIDYQGKKTILVSMIDMSRAKELEELVKVQDKMSSLGRVAAGIAHEIRNPLSGINIYLNTLEKIYEKPGDQEKVREIFSQLQMASNKIEAVIRRVMDFSKPSQPRLVLTDVNKPVEDALRLSAVALRKSGIEIETNLGRDLPFTRVDPHLIEQVIMNLLSNSAEAMKNMAEKKLGVRTALDNGVLVIRVADSGPGVPETRRDKVFDPFYTTKSDGTGIGLSISHRIISDHGGSFSVGASPWGGAEFTITLAAHEQGGRSQ